MQKTRIPAARAVLTMIAATGNIARTDAANMAIEGLG
jgi:hypothetical protein